MSLGADKGKRVIFLDMDGVLNSEAFLRKIDAQHEQLGHKDPARLKHEASCSCYWLEQQVDRSAVARLNRLVAETGAQIVISSSWRKLLDPEELRRILGSHGLVAEIIGETPDGHKDPEMLSTFGPLERIWRGHEIDLWLRRHPEVSRFVILDDASDMAMHQNRLVQTDCEEGLLDEHIDIAVGVLAWDGKSEPSPTSESALIDRAVRSIHAFRDPTNSSRWTYRWANGWRHVSRKAMLELGKRLSAARDGEEADAVHAAWVVEDELRTALREALDIFDASWCPEHGHGPGQETFARVEDLRKVANVGERDVFDSAWGIVCSQQGCPEELALRRSTAVAPSHENDYQQLCPALETAAVALGWAVADCMWVCPSHAKGPSRKLMTQEI